MSTHMQKRSGETPKERVVTNNKNQTANLVKAATPPNNAKGRKLGSRPQGIAGAGENPQHVTGHRISLVDAVRIRGAK